MKRFLLRLLCLALLAAALAPVGLRQYRLWRDARLVAAFQDAVGALEAPAAEALLAEAAAYNLGLQSSGLADPFASTAEAGMGPGDLTLLNPADSGVMAVLEIPKLGETLPVFHGTDAATLALGAGHLEGTSLPVEGASAPCALAAGRGWPVAGPFAGLDRLISGDRFTLRTAGETLVYEVCQTSVVGPGALAKWHSEGEGECLLMTTASRSSGAGRLLVLGRRVFPVGTPDADDSRALPEWVSGLLLAAPLVAVGLALMTIFEGLRRIVRGRRLRRLRL